MDQAWPNFMKIVEAAVTLMAKLALNGYVEVKQGPSLKRNAKKENSSTGTYGKVNTRFAPTWLP